MKSNFKLYAHEQELHVRFEPSGQEHIIAAGDYITISVWPLRDEWSEDAELTLDRWPEEIVISQDWCQLYVEDSRGMDVCA
ncbi:hypothetical protein ACFWUP_05025 [Nocardia sp. NPDC058658]|uniref:hypothetical protein n=1 Tax=Nocardia sp. NPDC058658 TaxID=3346580 RepID=UPI003658628C